MTDHNPIRAAIAAADKSDPNAPFVLHVTLTDGRVLSGGVNFDGALIIEDKDGCIFAHFINPAHVLFVRLEWR